MHDVNIQGELMMCNLLFRLKDDLLISHLVFPLPLLGFDMDPVNHAQFTNHTCI